MKEVTFNNKYFKRTVSVVFFFLIGCAFLPGFVIAGISMVYVLFSLYKGREFISTSYIVLIVSSLFYNAFQGQILFYEFDGDVSAGKLAIVFNYTAYLLFALVLTGKIETKGVRVNSLDVLIMAYSVWVFVCTLTAVDFSTSLGELKRLPGFLLLYLLTRVFLKNPDGWLKFMNISLGIIVSISLLSFYKIIIAEYYGTLGKFLFFLAPLIFVFYRSNVSLIDLRKFFLIPASFGLLVAESRRLFLGVGLIWLLTLLKDVRTLVLIVPLIFALNFIMGIIDEQGEGRYQKTFSQLGSTDLSGDLEASDFDQIGTGRGSLWMAAWNLTMDHPLFGVGVGNMTQLMPQYGNVREQRAHNILLDVTGQLGIPGLIIWLMILATCFRYSLNYWKKLKRRNLLFSRMLQGVGVALFVTFIAALFGGSMTFDKWGWVYLGFFGAMPSLYSRLEGN